MRDDALNTKPVMHYQGIAYLLERALHFQIISHLDNNGYLSENQHGFRAGKSTSTAILDLTRLLTDNYNKGEHTSCVFVDYKKSI